MEPGRESVTVFLSRHDGSFLAGVHRLGQEVVPGWSPFGSKKGEGVGVKNFFQVDAFTSHRFKGNPAAVCLLEEAASEDWMQSMAAEMNLSETAFLHPDGNAFSLRWFTPVAEVDLCGHATLASAHVLWENGRLRGEEEARFETRSGTLRARRTGSWIEMDFPSKEVEPSAQDPEFEKALGVEPLFIGRSGPDLFAELAGEGAVRGLAPNLTALGGLAQRGVIVTSQSDHAEHDFVSRFFAPAVGIDEDPVTGSAHCALGPYWMERLGKSELVGFQASRRGGLVRVRPEGDRVRLQGQATTVVQGQWL